VTIASDDLTGDAAVAGVGATGKAAIGRTPTAEIQWEIATPETEPTPENPSDEILYNNCDRLRER
jgi:hypothetical protein